ncbi:polysaccharide biosynthesis protein [Peribacillus sp. NPDC097198]|uniref:polysaccharide biosynthesis protein n=1 Tax=Peribacillus sp. NPDC097198 TaxID=3364397 RepID=UPI003810D957
MNYKLRLSLLNIIDSLIILVAILLSHYLLVSETPSSGEHIIIGLIFLACYHLFSFKFQLNKKSWEYASVKDIIIIFKTVTVSTAVTICIQLLFLNTIEIRFLAISWLLFFLFIGGSRLCWRIYRDSYLLKDSSKKRTLIIGAGSAGRMVARQLLKNNSVDLIPVAYIDDDINKQKRDILGIPVIGATKKIEYYVKSLNIEHIIIAIPSLDKQALNLIFQECAKTEAKTQILPMLEDLLTGKLSINKFRDVSVEDLLGRDPVQLNMDSISEYVTNKVILVTGAGGSIGSEICRQLVHFKPKQLILLGHGENSIYTIEMELKEKYIHTNIEFFTEIADIQDEKKILSVMGDYKPDVVYHAAAHKHVPLMEKNPEEAVKNNLIGTRNVAKASSWHGVQTFVMISSDKAVNPTSVMGATKRLAEMLIQNMDKENDTKFVAVRFGNVLGSRGSVIPLFTKQIEKGGPLTITHPDMVRYFMTIPEASRLVLQAGAFAQGGEIFVLDMGQPVKIVELAEKLILLSGHTIEEIGIEFTGIRPGEKLFEELLSQDEVHEKQIYPNIYVGKTRKLFKMEIENIIENYANLDKETLKLELINTANLNTVSQPVMSASS